MPGWAPPSNLSELIRDKRVLRIKCEACGHTAEPDLRQLKRDLGMLGGYREDLSDLPRYLSCSMCGEKTVSYTTFAMPE